MSGNGTAVRELTPAQKMKQLLESRKTEFAQALAGRINPEAFIRVAYTTMTKSPKLLEATPASLMMSLLEAASPGLVVNGVMGEAYLVPFNNKVKVQGGGERWEVQAQFIPGYRGLIKLARQSGVIRNIVARAVYAGDKFELEYGLEERLVHVPAIDNDDEARPLLRVYAVAQFTDGKTFQFEVMSKRQVDGIRARSKSKDSGPWVTDYEAMALKTVIRRLSKYLPLSDFDFARALEADDRADENDVTTLLEAQTRHAGEISRASQLRDRMVGAGPVQIAPEEEEAEIVGARVVEEETGSDTGDTPASGNRSGYEADQFLEAVTSTEVSGADATKGQRKQLRDLGARAFGAGTEEAVAIQQVADAADLGKGQASRLILLGEAAAPAADVQAAAAHSASGAAPANLFEES